MPNMTFGKGHMKRRYFSLSLLPLLFLGCRSEVARVGEIPITDEDLSRQARVSELYYPGSGQRYVALSQLIKGYLSLGVLKSLGQAVDEATVKGESRRIDEETQAPELLQKIKEVYQGDREAYLQSFVRTVYAERVLYHEVFLPSPEIHRASHEQAEGFLKEALGSPASFSRLAKQRGAEVARLRISAREGIRPEGKGESGRSEAPSQAHLEEAKRLIGSLSRIRPGQLCPEVIEWPEGFQVLRLLHREGRGVLVQSASIPKRDYEQWFWGQASQIPVWIRDPALKGDLLKEVAWAKNLNLR